MKAIPSISALLLVFGSTNLVAEVRDDRAQQEDYRVWTDTTGRHQIFALFERLDESSDTVYLQRSNGQRFRCGLQKLCDGDQAYVNSRIAPTRSVALSTQHALPTEEVSVPERTLASELAGPQLLDPARSRGSAAANLELRLSEGWLASIAEQGVEESTPIRDCILDTAIYGTGWTTGNVTVSLVPDEQRGIFDIRFKGIVLSDTVGYNGPVTIYNDSLTQLISRTRVTVGSQGLSMYATISRARNTSFTKSLETRFSGLVDWIVRQFAEQRLRRDRPLADAIGASHAEIQFNDRMNEELSDQVREANERFRDEVREPLDRLNLFPDSLQFSTTADAFTMQASLGDTQTVEHPAPDAFSEADLRLGVHQSFVNTAIARAIGGRTFTESEFRRQIEELLGELNLFEDRAGEENIRVTLDEERPVTVQYDDNKVVVTLRGSEFYLEDSSWPAMEISITYSLEDTLLGIKMTRIGAPTIRPLNAASEDTPGLGLRQILVRRLLANRLSVELKREVVFREFPFTELIEEDIGRLSVTGAYTMDGWLVMPLEYEPPADED